MRVLKKFDYLLYQFSGLCRRNTSVHLGHFRHVAVACKELYNPRLGPTPMKLGSHTVSNLIAERVAKDDEVDVLDSEIHFERGCAATEHAGTCTV